MQICDTGAAIRRYQLVSKMCLLTPISIDENREVFGLFNSGIVSTIIVFIVCFAASCYVGYRFTRILTKTGHKKSDKEIRKDENYEE